MRSILAIAGLLMLVAAHGALACPVITGSNPKDDMKAALDYYSGTTLSDLIAHADCAMEQFEVSKRHEEVFWRERGTVNYRYGRFLSEAADLQSRAGDRLRQLGGGTGVKYFERDYTIRSALLAKCLKDESVCNLKKEMSALADAYESARQAQDLHDWMISNSPESLAVDAALKVWLRAVASCPAWDFHPPLKDRSLYDWKGVCSQSCRDVAKDADRVLMEHGVRVSSLKPQLDALNMALQRCTEPLQ
jgi:hypothetical protein